VTEPTEAARVEALGTLLYRAAFRVGEVLNRVEAEPAAGKVLAESEAGAFDGIFINGATLMVCLKAAGLRLNRRAMGDAQDEMEAENGK